MLYIIGVLQKISFQVEREELDNKKLSQFKKIMAKEIKLTDEEHTQAQQNAKIFCDGVREIQNIIGEDRGWASEEEMIKNLAAFRRARQEL